MPLPEALIAWLLTNRRKLIRYAFIPQILVALPFLAFAHSTGRDHIHLLRAGIRTHGTIVGFKSVSFQTRSSSSSSFVSTAHLPIVEFRASDRLVRFQEWKDSGSDPGLGSLVPILYDPADASIAMMDRGPFNWLPWAPCAATGLLLALAALKGLFVFLFSSRVPSAANAAETSQ